MATLGAAMTSHSNAELQAQCARLIQRLDGALSSNASLAHRVTELMLENELLELENQRLALRVE